jgi:hypothetical protein
MFADTSGASDIYGAALIILIFATNAYRGAIFSAVRIRTAYMDKAEDARFIS